MSLIYIAGEIGEARGIERLLTEADIDYTIGQTPYIHVMLFEGAKELPGVGFYVICGQAEFCRRILLRAGHKRGVVMEWEE